MAKKERTIPTESVGPLDEIRVRMLSIIEAAAVYNELTGQVLSLPLHAPPRKEREAAVEALRKVVRHRLSYPPDRTKVADFQPGVFCCKFQEGSDALRLARILQRGATFDECRLLTGWEQKKVRDTIVRLHVHKGYGIKSDEAGRLRLVVPPREAE